MTGMESTIFDLDNAPEPTPRERGGLNGSRPFWSERRRRSLSEDLPTENRRRRSEVLVQTRRRGSLPLRNGGNAEATNNDGTARPTSPTSSERPSTSRRRASWVETVQTEILGTPRSRSISRSSSGSNRSRSRSRSLSPSRSVGVGSLPGQVRRGARRFSSAEFSQMSMSHASSHITRDARSTTSAGTRRSLSNSGHGAHARRSNPASPDTTGEIRSGTSAEEPPQLRKMQTSSSSDIGTRPSSDERLSWSINSPQDDPELEKLDSPSLWTDIGSNDFGPDEGDDESVVVFEADPEPTIFSCMDVLRYCCKRSEEPIGVKLGSWIALNSPCFWFCWSKDGLTDRAIVGRLNVVISFSALCQISSALWFAIVSFVPNLLDRTINNSPDYAPVRRGSSLSIEIIASTWNLSAALYALGGLAVLITTATLATIRVIRVVNLVGLVRFLWAILWFVPYELIFSLALIDMFQVTKVWMVHWWREDTMAWFRRVFCRRNTYNTLCTVPVSTNETQWCLDWYNSTQCSDIRNSAQTRMLGWMYTYYTISAFWGFALVVLMLTAALTLERLVTKPFVQKSSETSLPMWLLLPALGCGGMGFMIVYTHDSVLKIEGLAASWIGKVFIVAGVLFLLGSLLGWFVWYKQVLTVNDKHQKSIAILCFIVVMLMSAVCLVVLCFAGVGICVKASPKNILDDGRGMVACNLDTTGSCSRCEETTNRCPQWSKHDVSRVVRTQGKNIVGISAVFLVYSIAAFKFGLGLQKHMATYEIDYV